MTRITLERNKSGIYVPKRKDKGTPCGYCPTVIYRHNEVNGRIQMSQEGKPACARCRIMKLGNSKMAKRISKDKGKFEKDVEARNQLYQDNANKQAIEIALETQKAHPEVRKFK